jgi:hypothetical protein
MRGARGAWAIAVAAALAGAAALGGCGGPRAREQVPWYRAGDWNPGPERYSAWFADSDGRVLYFGLSPFWRLWWAGGNPLADLEAAGDQLIGRFDLATRRFLEPLRVCTGERCRSSVWDVLVHTNGRIYYTTFFEALGSVLPDGSDPRRHPELGTGLNELVEAGGGVVVATRYATPPTGRAGPTSGSLVRISPAGELLAEIEVPAAPGWLVSPKSVAVDPRSGEIWLNTDSFGPDGELRHEALRLAPDGALLERLEQSVELLFLAFDAQGRGWLAEDAAGRLRVRVVRDGAEQARVELGARSGADFVQDIRFAPDGTALLALWSSRVFLVRLDAARPRVFELRLAVPPDCVPPRGRSLLYTAVAFRGDVYATLYCGATVLHASGPDWLGR